MCIFYWGCGVCVSDLIFFLLLFFFKQKTAYELRISDWSSDVCSSDLDAMPSDIDLSDTDLFTILHTTRAMRRLKPDPVPDDLIRRILQAGIAAANGGNTQRWRFLAIGRAHV